MYNRSVLGSLRERIGLDTAFFFGVDAGDDVPAHGVDLFGQVFTRDPRFPRFCDEAREEYGRLAVCTKGLRGHESTLDRRIGRYLDESSSDLPVCQVLEKAFRRRIPTLSRELLCPLWNRHST